MVSGAEPLRCFTFVASAAATSSRYARSSNSTLRHIRQSSRVIVAAYWATCVLLCMILSKITGRPRMRDDDLSQCELAHTAGGLFQRRGLRPLCARRGIVAQRRGTKVAAAAMLPRDCLGESQIIRCG